MQKQNKYLKSTRQTEKQFVIVYNNENTRVKSFPIKYQLSSNRQCNKYQVSWTQQSISAGYFTDILLK